jgi:hypothetical protein
MERTQVIRKTPVMCSPSFHPGSTSPGRDRKPLESESVSVNAPTVEFFKNERSDRPFVIRGLNV